MSDQQIKQIILIILGLFTAFAGIISTYKPLIEWQIRFANTLRGTKTNITRETISGQRIMGGLIMMIGIGVILYALLIFPNL